MSECLFAKVCWCLVFIDMSCQEFDWRISISVVVHSWERVLARWWAVSARTACNFLAPKLSHTCWAAHRSLLFKSYISTIIEKSFSHIYSQSESSLTLFWVVINIFACRSCCLFLLITGATFKCLTANCWRLSADLEDAKRRERKMSARYGRTSKRRFWWHEEILKS